MNALSKSPNGSKSESVEAMDRQGRHIQEMVEKIESLPDGAARALLHDCMTSLLAFYGHGLERVMQIAQRGEIGSGIYEELVQDRVVSALLFIHGLHPVDLPTRLNEALERIRPYMQSHGGNVELLSLEGDFARLRLQGACETCPSSAATLELAVRHAIEEACPDLLGFEVEGASEHTPEEPQPSAPEWVPLEEVRDLGDGRLVCTTALGVPVVVCNISGQLYAYRDRCPACNLPLHLGALERGVLACRAGHRFNVQSAGIGFDNSRLHLEPLPLIIENGTVQISVVPASGVNQRISDGPFTH